ncbi:MAG: M16 family metallopeptidase [Spirosomataceae bacterium]
MSTLLDRTIAPPAQSIEKVNILKANQTSLTNGLTLYTIQAGEQPVLRLELIFDAGNKYDKSIIGTSFFTAKMLIEGTNQRSAAEISESFDQYGAFLEVNQTADRASIMVYGMTQHLAKVLPIIREMLLDSVIPEKELEIQRKIAIQNLKVNQEKTAFVASQIFREKIFSSDNAYGRSLKEENINQISRNDIVEFYQNHFKNRPFKVFLSGKFDETEINLVDEYLGSIEVNSIEAIKPIIIPENQSSGKLLVEKPENVQSTIRLGRTLFNRTHPDFNKFIVTNTILGGYFGSRLMKNIREEKGFTYGISSSLIPLAETGYLVIGTDVKKEFTTQTIDEIHKEIRILQTEKVSDDELDTVKNYLIGSFVGSLNTPFEIADRQKNVILDKLPEDFYEKYIERIRSVSAEDILEIANKYYQIEGLSEVVVGGYH